MSPEKLSALKYLKNNGPQSALDIAKKFCGMDRYGYMAWYNRLADMQADGYVQFKNDNSLPLCSVVLTPRGEDVLAQEQKLLLSKRGERIRYIITTAIAVAAFVKSFFF